MLASRLLGLLPEPHEIVANAAPLDISDLLIDIGAARHFPTGFLSWAKHWHFRNRESGAQMTFANPWPGQLGFARLMMLGEWIFALKAGKLGFTELECCWDGYVLWCRRNARVHLFSKEANAAAEMLAYVKFGLSRMAPAWGIKFLSTTMREVEAEKAGTKQFKMTVALDGDAIDFGDVRTLVAYATGKNPAIDQSCQHAHVDEWAHMEDPKGAWSSIETTVAPGGTCHIVTRGAGEHKDVEETWTAATERKALLERAIEEGRMLVSSGTKLVGYFASWDMRPDRDRDWYETQAATLPSLAALSHYAAETPDDAFRGDEDDDFVPIEAWDHCLDPYLVEHQLQPASTEAGIMGVDAAVHHDIFGAVLVTRHPLRPDDPAIRLTKFWAPELFVDGVIDLATVQGWIRAQCQGGCSLGHPQYEPWIGGKPCKPLKGQEWAPGDCPACAAIAAGQAQPIPAYNIYELAYDPYQLEAMMQELRRDGVVWCNEFAQGADRLEADRNLKDVIVGRRLSHAGSPKLREHIQNAKAKTSATEDAKIRIIKKAGHRRIDLVVAASMAVREVMRLNL